jgi:hypothetical protein
MLCEFATIRNGLVTIVNGGIDNVQLERLPSGIRMFAHVDARPGALAPGPHDLKADLTGPDGKPSVFSIRGGIVVSKPEVWTRLAFSVEGEVQAYGPLLLRVTLGPLSGDAPLNILPLTVER